MSLKPEEVEEFLGSLEDFTPTVRESQHMA